MSTASEISRFQALLLQPTTRIMAVCGAGLSAPSGLSTFRGAGGLWRNHNAMSLATPEAFSRDPGLVWLFYAYRRHMSLEARPNPGHFALAELAKKMGNRFLCVSQNVDDLLQRAGIPQRQLHTIHGHLFDLKCSIDSCNWTQKSNRSDPLWPILASASQDPPSASQPLPNIPRAEIPLCPQCGSGFQRPDIVWFGEWRSEDMDAAIDDWLSTQARVDVVMSIGTSEVVNTGSYFIESAMEKGAVYCNVNLEAEIMSSDQEGDGGFAFGGSVAELLPLLFEPLIGKLEGEESSATAAGN